MCFFVLNHNAIPAVVSVFNCDYKLEKFQNDDANDNIIIFTFFQLFCHFDQLSALIITPQV